MQTNFIKKYKTWLKSHQGDVVLILLMGLVGLYSGLWAKHIILDDAMITFRVAENLAYGRGFVYNVGERVQVTTTPLYAIILAGGTWIFGSAPGAALRLNISLAVLIPVLAYDVGRRLAGRITGIGGALLLSVAPLLLIAFSMESYLYVALILASMDAYVARRYSMAGVLVGITVLVRGDAVLMGAVLLSYDFLMQRRLYWRLIIPAISIPAGWYGFATLYYGSPFPATLQAKTAQGSFDWLGKHFVSGFFAYWEVWLAANPFFYLFPALIILGLIQAIRREQLWLVFVGRDILYIITFVALGVTFAEWYYAPLMPGLALMTARGVQVIADGGAKVMRQIVKSNSALPQLVSTLVAAGLIFLLVTTLYPVSADIISSHPDWKAQAYPDAARWIAKNTNQSATLATIDIGHLGYWSGRPIIDIVGLAQPDVAAHIAEGDFGYAIRQYEPDMVLLGASWLPEVRSLDWFQESYNPRHTLKLNGMAEPLVLFSRPEGVKVQSHSLPKAKIQALDVDFNQQVTLRGYYFNTPVKPDGFLNLTLIWQVETSIAVDFTVFVQLVDADNTIVTQGDGKPQQGFYATPYWEPGEQILDSYTLPIGADTHAGQYDILLGFYEVGNGARLQILDEKGQFQNDHIRISGIEIQ